MALCFFSSIRLYSKVKETEDVKEEITIISVSTNEYVYPFRCFFFFFFFVKRLYFGDE